MKNLIIAFFTITCITLQAQELKVGTYNLRYNNTHDSINAWPNRKNVVISLIRFYDFDVLGTQEALSDQVADLLTGLPDYAIVGVGRDDGKTKGEYAAIFYKKSKFTLMNSGTFWLSEKDIRRPNKGWDAALPRICTWVQLKDKKTNKIFFHFNTHFDHVGKQARANSARLIIAMIKKIAGNAPVILSGDFNVDQNNDPYKLIVNSGILWDAYSTARVRFALNGTFNAFNSQAYTDSRIDHVFVSRKFKAIRYGVLTDSYRKPLNESVLKARSDNFPGEVHLYQTDALLPSDHFPVLVQAQFK